jgi:hypothetical protein
MKKILYRDKLVEINDDSIVLNKFYFPTLSPKVIAFSDIYKIEVRKPTIWSGKWRIHGTGNFRTWYPYDSSRPKRDRIFIVSYKNKWIQSGFTVENSAKVESILRDKKLIK